VHGLVAQLAPRKTEKLAVRCSRLAEVDHRTAPSGLCDPQEKSPSAESTVPSSEGMPTLAVIHKARIVGDGKETVLLGHVSTCPA
jgi:hypothetical protein